MAYSRERAHRCPWIWSLRITAGVPLPLPRRHRLAFGLSVGDRRVVVVGDGLGIRLPVQIVMPHPMPTRARRPVRLPVQQPMPPRARRPVRLPVQQPMPPRAFKRWRCQATGSGGLADRCRSPRRETDLAASTGPVSGRSAAESHGTPMDFRSRSETCTPSLRTAGRTFVRRLHAPFHSFTCQPSVELCPNSNKSKLEPFRLLTDQDTHSPPDIQYRPSYRAHGVHTRQSR